MPLLMQQILSTQDVDINKGVHYVFLDNDKRQPVRGEEGQKSGGRLGQCS